MMLILLALCFVASCLLAWLLMFRASASALAERLVRQRRLLLRCLGGLGVAAVPALAAWLASRQVALPGYAAAGRGSDPRILALLQGEQLAPPPPLPPLAFSTAEVSLLRPALAGADRDWSRLDNGFARMLLVVFALMRERHGYEMALLEGYRSPERQDALAASGAHVSNARAFQSYHQYGLAADCAFLRDGRLVISERDPWAMRGYTLYGELAEEVGMVWGGRWAMRDLGHAELRARPSS